MVMFCFQQIVKMMDSSCGVLSLHVVINNIITLGLEGEHMCFMLARVSSNQTAINSTSAIKRFHIKNYS